MITVETLKTENGYYGRVVAEGHAIMYTTPVYFTQFMAMADANCWEAFHMTGTAQEEPKSSEYTIDYADTIYESGSKLNTEKVIATITKANQHPNAAYKVGPLTGRMVEFKGWKLSLYMPEGKFWRTFDIIK